MTKRQAIKEVRQAADAIIEQAERRAKGWDKGFWRDDERDCNRQPATTISRTIEWHVNYAFSVAHAYRD